MTDQIKTLYDKVVRMLTENGWQEQKVAHYRKQYIDGQTMPFAMEPRYVHGEVSVRVQRLRGEVDSGNFITLRGRDDNLLVEVSQTINQIENGALQ